MKDYSSDPLLRLMKNAPAAPAITTTPMIVKRYVPIPPVDGRDPSLVSFILVVCVRTSLAIPLSSSATSSVALTSVVFTEYPCGAVTSLKRPENNS